MGSAAINGPAEVFNLTGAVSSPVLSSLSFGLVYSDAGVPDMNFICTSLSFSEGNASAVFSPSLPDSGVCNVVQTKIGKVAGEVYEGTFTGAVKKIVPTDGGYLSVTGGSYRFIR